jgi:hypothetical protein
LEPRFQFPAAGFDFGEMVVVKGQRFAVYSGLYHGDECVQLTLTAVDAHACQVCGRTFTPARSDAVYCSSACRQKAYRQRL